VGQAVASIEAMKMEATITASVTGVVKRIALSKPQSVEAGDLILVIESE
jgi:pyruvate carboxylase